MWTQLRLLNSSSESLAKPISLYMSMPCTLARASRKGKSNESPLYVAQTVGRASRKCSKKRRIVAA